jgi:DNA-binding transcriptional MerR regulator
MSDRTTIVEVWSEEQVYDLEKLARLSHEPRDRVEEYWRLGLIEPSVEREIPLFGDYALYILRRVRFLRDEHGLTLSAIAMILDLEKEVESLKSEIRFLREL